MASPATAFASRGLARSRRAYEQRPFGILAPSSLVFVGLLEEIDDLHDLDLGLLQAGHVLERHALGVILVEHLRLGFADVHNATARLASGPRDIERMMKNHTPMNQHPRQQVDQNVRPVVGLVF